MKTRFWALLLGALAVLSCEKTAVMEVPVPEVQAEPDPWTVVPMKAKFQPGELSTVVASFAPETRSHIEMNEAGNHASVVWSPNDQFILYADTGYYSIYTTTTGGADAEFSGYGYLGSYSFLYGIYPYKNWWKGTVTYGDETYSPVIEVEIPEEQVATVGSVAEGVNISFVTPESTSDHFSFHNLLSLVKFQLSGDLVSQVKSVTFKGTSDVAGDYFVYITKDGPELLSSVQFQDTQRSRTVTLSGTFEADKDYYIALAPCQQAGFQMIFANEDGSETTTFTSTMNLAFPRSQILDFGTLDLGNAFTDAQEPSYDPVAYNTASNLPAGAKPVTLAVLPDGYTAGEMAQYEMDAYAGLNALFSTEPYKSYRNYFNVWIFKVASNESGANVTDGNGNITTARDCYFGSYWGASSYNDMDVLDEDKVYNYVKENCPDIKNGIHTIYEVPILLLINDGRYGGRAHSWSDGKTFCQVPMTDRALSWSYPSQQAKDKKATQSSSNTVDTPSAEIEALGHNSGDWRNVLVHEFGGHSIARLGDEYWYQSSDPTTYSISSHNWDVPFDLNISASYSYTPWDYLLKTNHGSLDSGEVRDDLVATDPNYGRIGVFQGADVSMFNRWRSEKISCMIDNRFYFSTLQRYLIVERIMKLAGVIANNRFTRLSWDDFFLHDVTTDPVRDQVNSSVKGVSDRIPPREVPMLPPPDLREQ